MGFSGPHRGGRGSRSQWRLNHHGSALRAYGRGLQPPPERDLPCTLLFSNIPRICTFEESTIPNDLKSLTGLSAKAGVS